MAGDGILIFAGKWVGAQLVDHLLQIHAPMRRVVVASDADQPIVDRCRCAGMTADIFSSATLQELVADRHRYAWLLNLWSPHLLRAEVLNLADHRLNVHSSLVPHCRGNDNAAWIIRKHLPAGVSLIEMTDRVDAGDVYAQRRIDYSFPIRGGELHRRLQEQAVALFKEAWPDIAAGRRTPQPQVGPVTEHRRRDTEADRIRSDSDTMTLGGFVDWVLAHDFAPGTTAVMQRDGRPYRLRLTVEPDDASAS